MIDWAKAALVYEKAPVAARCCRCDNFIEAEDSVVRMPGLHTRGHAHPACLPSGPGPVTSTVCDDPYMADPVPAGSDVSSGTYKCTNCGYKLQVGSTKHLPPCPSCGNGHYETLSGGDSVNDPYPNRK